MIIRTLFFGCFLALFSIHISAQETARDRIKEKFEDEIHKLVSSSSAVIGFMAVDLLSGEELSMNSELSFPQASAIKIPVLMEVFKQAEEGKFSLTDPLPVDPESIVGGTGVLRHLTDLPIFSIRDLCVLMMVLSDNTATNILIDLVGMKQINETLRDLGLEKTLVQRKMINSAASGRGDENLSTPAEAARILQLLYDGEYIDQPTSEEIISILRKTGRNHSRLAAGIPEEVPMGFKPGFLNGVSTEWAIIFLQERPYAVSVMESYKKDAKDADVIEQLSKLLYDYYWMLGNATQYGTYMDPELIKE